MAFAKRNWTPASIPIVSKLVSSYGTWQIAEQAQPFEDAKLAVTERAELQQGIEQLMQEIKQDIKREDVPDGS